jgi:hypothetical protein
MKGWGIHDLTPCETPAGWGGVAALAGGLTVVALLVEGARRVAATVAEWLAMILDAAIYATAVVAVVGLVVFVAAYLDVRRREFFPGGNRQWAAPPNAYHGRDLPLPTVEVIAIERHDRPHIEPLVTRKGAPDAVSSRP